MGWIAVPYIHLSVTTIVHFGAEASRPFQTRGSFC
jgi:hypothetical protein